MLTGDGPSSARRRQHRGRGDALCRQRRLLRPDTERRRLDSTEPLLLPASDARVPPSVCQPPPAGVLYQAPVAAIRAWAEYGCRRARRGVASVRHGRAGHSRARPHQVSIPLTCANEIYEHHASGAPVRSLPAAAGCVRGRGERDATRANRRHHRTLHIVHPRDTAAAQEPVATGAARPRGRVPQATASHNPARAAATHFEAERERRPERDRPCASKCSHWARLMSGGGLGASAWPAHGPDELGAAAVGKIRPHSDLVDALHPRQVARAPLRPAVQVSSTTTPLTTACTRATTTSRCQA